MPGRKQRACRVSIREEVQFDQRLRSMRTQIGCGARAQSGKIFPLRGKGFHLARTLHGSSAQSSRPKRTARHHGVPARSTSHFGRSKTLGLRGRPTNHRGENPLSTSSEPALFARLIREQRDDILDMLAENVASLIGKDVDIKPLEADSPEIARIFGRKELFVFPLENHEGEPYPSLLALDLTAAVYSGAAFSMMGDEQIREVMKTKEVPEILFDSIGEVANIICGAAANAIRDMSNEPSEFRRGADFRMVKAKAWPGLLGETDATIPWEIAAGTFGIGDGKIGAILFASSDSQTGTISPEAIQEVCASSTSSSDPDQRTETSDHAVPSATPEASDSGPSLCVHVLGVPTDARLMGLRQLLVLQGAKLSPLLGSIPSQETPDVVFVVSRSASDLALRLEALRDSGRTPALCVACSDRPTRDLVLAARKGGADEFLVLPAPQERIAALLEKILAPA